MTMTLTRGSLKTATVLVAAGALGFGLMGTGVRAAFTDGGTVTQNINNGAVGALACTLSSTDAKWVISADKHTATLTWPAITSSAAGSDLSSLTVNNTGTVPEVVTWTEAQTGNLTSGVSYTLGSPSMATPVTLAAAANQTYTGLGFSWTALTNADLGTAGSVTYTAACGEVTGPPPFQSPLSAVLGNSNPQSVGYDGGSSNLAPMSVYLASIHNGGSTAMQSFTMRIPFTTDNGGPIDCSITRSASGITGCTIAGGILTVTYSAPASPYVKLAAGGTWTGTNLAGGALVYVGTANASFGTVVTWGPISFTASVPAS